MHFVSDPSMQRAGYTYNSHGVGWPSDSEPHVKWKHIDGPLLVYSDGQMHWLTLWERLCCWLGKADAFSIEKKRRPELRR
jgi:hypothetical protein